MPHPVLPSDAPPQRPVSTRRFTLKRLAAAAALVVGTVGAATVSLVNAPDAAAVAGLQYAGLNSARDSSTFKEVFVPCPDNTRGLGGGAVTGQAGTKITGIVPSATGVRFTASELAGGTSVQWRLEGLAICAPASSLPGLRYVPQPRTAQGPSNEKITPGTTAFCTNGQMIGMGGSVRATGPASPSPELLNLMLIVPEAEGVQHSVTVRADSNGYAGTFDVSAVAVCVNAVAGHRVVEGTFLEGTGQDQVLASVNCPEGTQPHAAGFFVDYQTDSVRQHAYATAVAPFRGGGILNPHVAVVGQPNGSDLDWSASANGICAT